MDFFRAQDDARRRTWRLVALFVLAVIALVVVTNLLVGLTLAWYGTHTMVTSLDPLVRTLPTTYWPAVTLGVVGTIGAASGYKYVALRSGGRAIVNLVGGRRLDPGSTEPAQRRLLNVVEEMAIASGMPVPPAYVLPDPAINAFAAGHGPDDAIIAVTEGTLAHLTRDELQGVVGHEFSHILNGDSRLNLRLVAALHGILFIGLVGRGMARGARYGRRREGPMLGLLGVGLIAVGFAGTFCGNLIKAAVSRQREFLADAAAVQFTRNPEGIAGALKKIGATAGGSTLSIPRAAEISHFFFAQALKARLGGWMATHPPLPERIRALEPRWDGNFATLTHTTPTAERDPPPEPTSALHGAARDSLRATELCYALVLGHDGSALELIDDAHHREVVGKLHADVQRLGLMERLTLVSRAMPALKQMSESQYRAFVDQVIALIKSDRKIDLFEWVLHRLMLKELRPQFETVPPPPIRYTSLDAAALPMADLTRELAARTPDFDRLNEALKQLRMLTPLAKPKLLKACVTAVTTNTPPTDDQRALLLGIAAALDCPLSPDADLVS